MKLTSEGMCQVGMRAGINQDAIGIFQDESQGLFLVADGMGGHSDGERASRELVSAFEEWWHRYLMQEIKSDFEQVLQQIKEVLYKTNTKIWEDTIKEEICGSTVVILWVQSGRYAVIWLGDSRCYKAEPGFLRPHIKQLTMDDVWENQPNLIQNLSKREIANHPNRGKLIGAVGVREHISCTVQTDSIKGKTLFALCSDGIYKYVKEELLFRQIGRALTSEGLSSAVSQIQTDVYRNHAPDNSSCIFVKIEG